MKKHNNEIKWFLIYNILVTCIVTIIYGDRIYLFIVPKLRLYIYLSIVALTSILIFELTKIFIIDFRVMGINKYILVLVLLFISVLFKLDILDSSIPKLREVNLLKQNIYIYKVNSFKNSNLVLSKSSYGQIIKIN